MILARDIARAVARVYDIAPEDLKTPSRFPPLPEAKHVAFWLSHRIGGISITQTGRRFSHHHTTVMYGLRQIDKRRRLEPAFAEHLFDLVQDVREGVDGAE